jgi:hypothetical protein
MSVTKVNEDRDEAYKALEEHLRRMQHCTVNGHNGSWLWVDSDGGIHTFRRICKYCGQLSNLIIAPDLET